MTWLIDRLIDFLQIWLLKKNLTKWDKSEPLSFKNETTKWQVVKALIK